MFKFINKAIRNHRLDQQYLRRAIDNRDQLCCNTLATSQWLGYEGDYRKYVGVIGFFTEDMMTTHIPDLVWYVRRDGNIWAEWYQSPKDWNKEMIRVPMSAASKQYINKLSRELWVVHKLGSDINALG